MDDKNKFFFVSKVNNIITLWNFFYIVSVHLNFIEFRYNIIYIFYASITIPIRLQYPKVEESRKKKYTEITKRLSIPLFIRPQTIVSELQLIHIPLVRLSASEFRRLSRIVAPYSNRLENRFPHYTWLVCQSVVFFPPSYYYILLRRVSRRPLSQKRLINLTDACSTSHCLQMPVSR